MIENAVKRRLHEGLPVVGHWISLPSPAVAELMASFEPDWLMIDTEHGPAGGEVVEDLIRAMKGTPTTPLVRVAGNDPALIKQALDRGAMGVLVPMVSTADGAHAAVSAARFPPEGIRRVAVQIETAQALENAEALECIAQGFRFIGLSSDARMLASAMAADAERLRQGLQAWRPARQ